MQDASESKWLIFSACSLLLFLMNFDMSGVNLALAPITVDLKLSIVDVQWIISAYMIGGAAFVLLGGVLGDRFGYRRIFSIGTLIFTIASLIAGLADNNFVLISARFIQGIGAALAWPLAIVVVRRVFVNQEGLAMGLITSVMATSMAIGPALGGVILYYFDWRFIFLINVPLGAAIMFVAFYCIPSKNMHDSHQTALHLPSAILLILGLLSLSYAVNQGLVSGILHFPNSLLLMVGILGLGLFVVMQKVIENPLINIQLLLTGSLSQFFMIRFLWQVNWIGLLLILSLYFQNILGFNPLHSSVYFLTLSLSYALLSPFGGILNNRFSSRQLIIFGLVLSFIPLGILAISGVKPTMVWLMVLLAIYGISTAMVFPSLLNGALSSVDTSQRGMVSGIIYLMLFTGGTVGAMTVGSLLNYISPDYLFDQMSQQGIMVSKTIQQGLINYVTGSENIHKVAALVSESQAKDLIPLLSNGFYHGFSAVMKTFLLASILMLILAFRIKR